ncbi:hypothetical protein HDU99_010433, partial [Rhizoclosmatium hyalinum]
MKDQVDFLRGKGVKAAFFNSTLTIDEEQDLFRKIDSGQIKILYIAPERLQKESFVNRISSVKIDMLVIDEAHCISEWGHSFRPDYLLLTTIAKSMNIGQFLCTTATATPKCAQDIITAFDIRQKNLFRSKFHRSNLHIQCETSNASGKNQKVLDLLERDLAVGSPYRGSGIAYCTLQRESTDLAAFLKSRGYSAKAYHAGMKDIDRLEVQNWFMDRSSDEIKIVCATIAFGMGIDKPDVRFIYHITMAKSVESFAQEIGRAGRDGLPSVCRTILCADDLPVLKS